jgi:SAM-dependent methyltransferase
MICFTQGFRIFRVVLLVTVFLSSFPSLADKCLLIDQLLSKLSEAGVVVANGKMVRTDNRHGTSIVHSDPYLDSFVATGATAKEILEIGAGHGFMTARLLEASSARITVNDLSEGNLSSLKELLSTQQAARIDWKIGAFPAVLNDYPDDSFDAILMARVIHFFQPDDFQRAARELYRLVRPGGTVTVTALTPENSHFAGFFETYVQRRANGDLWPGAWVRSAEFRPNAPLPDNLHLLDPHVFVREFLGVGFRVVKAGYIDRNSQYATDILLRKREGVGITVVKPRPI